MKKNYDYKTMNFSVGFIFFFIIYCHFCFTIKNIIETSPIKEEVVAIEKVIQIEEKQEVVYVPPEVPLIRRTNYYCLTQYEKYLLQQLAMAEAQGQGVKGQALVMRVVINRALKSGKDIKEIVYAKGQFYTIPIGHFIPNEDNEEAIDLIVNGWDESEGALFFNCGGYRRGKEALFKHGEHYFTK